MKKCHCGKNIKDGVGSPSICEECSAKDYAYRNEARIRFKQEEKFSLGKWLSDNVLYVSKMLRRK